MARIRTIKPDFWTDETITECSPTARLLFIGTWNFADDKGNLEHSAKQLKMKIFPGDDVKVLHFLNELIAHGLLIEYSVSGKKYLHIKGFEKHQVINRPSSSPIPEFDDSLITHGGLIEGMEGNGKEGKGREKDRAGTPFIIPPSIRLEVWTAFEDHRKKIRKPMTNRARALIIEECEKLGGDPNKLLEQSITRGWASVFPLKGDYGVLEPHAITKRPPTIKGNCHCGKLGTTVIGGEWSCDECMSKL